MVDINGRWYPDYPGQQPFMDPQYIRMQGQQPTQQQPTQTTVATMTPPTIHAEIVQVDGEQSAAQYPVGAGMSQMMMNRDESAIYVKEATQNGYRLVVYDRRPEAPPAPPFNPSEYVRIDALPALVAAEVQAAMAAMQPVKAGRPKKDTEVTE